jgi:hypothetical protein
LLTIGIARAELSVTITPIKSTIEWNDTAIYTVTITNTGIADTIKLKPATYNWGTIRFDDYALYVPSSATTKVYVQPPRDILIGNYAIEIIAISNSQPEIRASDFLKLTVTSELPHIEPDYNLPNELKPGPTHLTLILKNTGTTAVEGIAAKLESDLLKEPVVFDVGSMASGEARVVWDTTLDIPLNTTPKDHTFTLSIYKNNEFVNSYTKTYKILESPAIKTDVNTEQKLLGTKYTVTLTNVGNAPGNADYKIIVPSWQRFFIEGKQKPTVTIVGNNAEVYWSYFLSTGESTTFVYTISFLPLLAILIAILVLLYVGFWYLSQSLTISKELVRGERALKIKLSIKNNSTRPQRNVIVEDSIPTPLILVREFTTLPPTAIKKSDGAMKLLWKFDVIWPHEEKILTYGLKSALGIVGTVLLPAAKLKKKGEPGETPKVFFSNRIAVQGRIKAE